MTDKPVVRRRVAAAARGAGARGPSFPCPGRVAVAATLLVVGLASPLAAHEDPGSRIAEISHRIESRPDDAGLYLLRADLYRSRGEWIEALSDLQTVSRLDPETASADLLAARVLLQAGNPQTALTVIDRFLARDDGSAGGHLVRARILGKVGSPADAAAEFTRGIDLARASGRPAQPDDYLARARALAAADENGAEQAIAGLDEGAALLGGAITLRLAAIDLERSRQHWDSALARLGDLEARAVRKEPWLERRADVLLEAGRRSEAACEYQAALAAIDALPARLRATRATADMEARVHARLGELGGAGEARCARGEGAGVVPGKGPASSGEGPGGSDNAVAPALPPPQSPARASVRRDP